MVTETTITRREVERARTSKGWLLIYGRRKVGKTFLVRNFIEHDLYVLVKRGGGALFDGGPLERTDDYGQVMEIIFNALKEGKTVAVDEFQRLPEEFAESLQMHYPDGRLLLLGSSMHVARDMLSRRSPLLGILSEIRLSLISPVDIFTSLSDHVGPEGALALSPYLRDPWAIRFLDEDPKKAVLDIMEYSESAIPALIGEVFLDEGRFMSGIYESVVRAVAGGKTTLKEVSDQLFSKKLIDANDPSRIRQYVRNMEQMDLLERVPLFGKRGNYYTVKSKIMDLYYYIDEKYGIERRTSSLLNEIIEERLPHHVESFVGELMGEILGGTFMYHMSASYDMDVVIAKRGRPVFIGEVKWRKRVRKSDVRKFLRNTERFDCRKAFITKSSLATDEVEVITPKKLLSMAEGEP
ncbi:MAG: AAA family ATPase [Candidatus Thermoplasmatota archaeon]